MDMRALRGNYIRKKLLLICLILSASWGFTEIPASAAENTGAAGGDASCVLIRVEGELEEADRESLVDRLNGIRREACSEGVRNPVNGEPLTPADYVPLQWSYDLESIAALRAAESTILQDHVRPDGRDCFTAAPEGTPYTMETLAWGFGGAQAALEGWYSEKASYVGETGDPAGHYMALINPENRFVGIADLRAQWQRDACAGAFAPAGNETPAGSADPAEQIRTGEETVWMIPLRKEFLETVLGRAVEITAVRIRNAAAF